jgi:hypothetical protein
MLLRQEKSPARSKGCVASISFEVASRFPLLRAGNLRRVHSRSERRLSKSLADFHCVAAQELIDLQHAFAGRLQRIE